MNKRALRRAGLATASLLTITSVGSVALPSQANAGITPDTPTAGGVVHVIGTVGDMSSSFDPRDAYYSDVNAIQSDLIVRSLTQFTYDPSTGKETLVPDLATDLGQSNANYTSWTFHLKPGIEYSDGTPITSEDIAYTVSSALDCNTFYDCPANYLLGNVLKGSDTVRQGQIASGTARPMTRRSSSTSASRSPSCRSTRPTPFSAPSRRPRAWTSRATRTTSRRPVHT